MNGTVFDIQRFSLNDGPGIRTIVFLKGCMLDCLWCHNPESKASQPQLKFLENKCTQCRTCGDVCPNKVHEWTQDNKHIVHFDRCKACGKCTHECIQQALSIVGKQMSALEVVEELEKDKKYYEKSGGGITISGGEVLYQPDFAIEIASLAKSKGLHVVVETSGYGNPEAFQSLAKYVDIFYFDCKQTTNALHESYVGVDLSVIEKNRRYLREQKIPVVLRCPLIPEYNLNQQHIEAIANIYRDNRNIIGVEVLPYHSLGISKSMNIGYVYALATMIAPTNQQIDEAIQELKALGVDNVKKG